MLLEKINIKGFKSIKDETIDIKPINILIGANGAGKSNFISFFEFLHNLYEQKLEEYVALRGGTNKFLFQGEKITNEISVRLFLGKYAYSFTVKNGEDNFIFSNEDMWYLVANTSINNYTKKAQIKNFDTELHRGGNINNFIRSIKKYHFHDTGKNSPFTQLSHTENDSYFLYEKGENLAAFLFEISKNQPKNYKRIIKTIQSIAPYFSDFYFQANKEGYIRLQWQSKYNSIIYGANDFSDGTLRFIALTVLFLQANVPNVVIIDEPELGLHPFAIAKLAGMIKSVAAQNKQVILATQSADLVNHFEPENVLTVDQINGESKFTRLSSEKLEHWLETYAIGDLWQQNIIDQGQVAK